jgi:prevent-host-death family protein
LKDGPVIEITEVAEPATYLVNAVELYGARIRALQIVHADDRGHWPWEVGYRGIRGARTMLCSTRSTILFVEATSRELNQQTARVLARVEAGETVTVTRNGKPVAVIRPYGPEEPPAYSFRTDPMGPDVSAPTFRGASDFSERVDELLAEFGSDE